MEEILIRLSQLGNQAFPEIVELDIDPLIMDPDGACAVDCRVLVESSDIARPEHLVISPYPNQYEKTLLTRGEMQSSSGL